MKKLPKVYEILLKKYTKDFDPRQPSVELLDAIRNTKSPKHASLTAGTRDKSLSELPMDTIEYIAYELNFRTTITKLYAKFQYYIMLYERLHEVGMDDDDFREVIREEFNIELPLSEYELEYNRHLKKGEDE